MADDSGDMAQQEAVLAEQSGADAPERDAPGQTERGLAAALAAALWDTAPGDVDPLPTDVSALLGGQGSAGSVKVTAGPVHDPYDPSLPATLAPPGGWTPVPDEPAVRLPVQTRPQAPLPQIFEPPEWLLERLDELLRLEQRHSEHVSTLLAQTEARTEDLVRMMLDPLLLGLVRLADRMVALADPTADLLRVQLLQILDVVGVESFAPEPGDAFDATRHRGVHPVPTDDPDLDGRVARTLVPGWQHCGGRLVRVADVEVHRLRADAEADDVPPTEGTSS